MVSSSIVANAGHAVKRNGGEVDWLLATCILLVSMFCEQWFSYDIEDYYNDISANVVHCTSNKNPDRI